MWDWDLLTDRITWDPGTGPLLDYEFSQLGGHVGWWYERIHPADRERVMGSIDAAISEARSAWTEEYRFRRADGTYAVVQDRAHIEHDDSGTPNRVISAMSGLTNTQGAERHLQQVLDALHVGVSVIDKQGRIVVANTSDKQLWGGEGAGAQELAEHKAWWADTGEPVRPEEWGAARAIQGEFSVEEEVMVETPEGDQKLIRSSAAPIVDERGEIVGAVNVSEDVTAARAAEAARGFVRRRSTGALKRWKPIGRLAGGIAHDFNNLLTGILSYSDLILQDLRPADPLRTDVEQIRDAGQRAAGLTRQLLAFSRRQLLQPKVVSLNATAAAAGADVGPARGSRHQSGNPARPWSGHRAGRSWSAGAGTGESGDECQRSHAARRTDSDHHRKLAIRRAQSAPEFVSLWVSDTGTGMDPTVVSHIFEPFFSTKRGGSGTGLGLSTVYGIVEQSGGKITVESTPDEGSTFGIHFPWHGPGEQSVPTTARPVAQRREGENSIGRRRAPGA